MAVSYKKLWKLLIDKDMKKKELEEQAKVSHYTVSKAVSDSGPIRNIRLQRIRR